jgi:CheY-like chemotaxis protein
MNRILAVEPDADRGALLGRLVQESLNTNVVLATSADNAIAAMTVEPPDLILMSVLLTATEDQRLLAHLRATLRERIETAGYRVTDDVPLEGFHRCHVRDPFGNRLELVEPIEPG